MSVTTRVGAPAGPARETAAGRRPIVVHALARWATRALVVVALFLGAGAVGLGLYASAHADRIYEGVAVAGVPIGGMDRAAARAALERRFAAYAAAPLTLTAGEATYAVTPAAAGATLDGEATVAAAFAYGRAGDL